MDSVHVVACCHEFEPAAVAARLNRLGERLGVRWNGLLIDNAAHFLHRYAGLRRRDAMRRDAVLGTLRHVGRPMLLSSSLLIAGFATAATSHLSTTVEFAILACSTIALALLATAVLLPLLLAAPSADVRHEH